MVITFFNHILSDLKSRSLLCFLQSFYTASAAKPFSLSFRYITSFPFNLCKQTDSERCHRSWDKSVKELVKKVSCAPFSHHKFRTLSPIARKTSDIRLRNCQANISLMNANLNKSADGFFASTLVGLLWGRRRQFIWLTWLKGIAP